MLLDKYTLTKSFEHLLSFHGPSTTASTATHSTASFVKRVNHTMGRVDPLLKTLQVRPSPPEGLVQAYLIHIADRSDTNFRKILDLKGVRKPDQPHLMELFAIHRDSSSASVRQLVQNSPLLTPLMSQPGSLGSGGLAGMNAASSGMQGRFDAASLGEKLLNAARDGVDRLGTSAAVAGTGSTAGGLGLGLGIGMGTGSAVSPGAAGGVGAFGAGVVGSVVSEKATINENLKNIGKFFRRDIGGLGARFGKRDLTPTGISEDGQRH